MIRVKLGPQQENLLKIIRRFGDQKLLIVGDAIADRFLFGSISRVSREAPVFILRHEQTETIPGGAANCAVNLASLGAKVALLSVVGKDNAGGELLTKLEASGVDISSVIASNKIQTTTKVRILAGQTHSSRQQVIRIDYEDGPLSDDLVRKGLLQQLRDLAAEVNAVIISDYNYGVVDETAVGILRERHRSSSLPVLVDSRFRSSSFTGLTAATPHGDELEHLIDGTISSIEQLEAEAIALKQRLGHQALLVTRGSQGMMLIEEGQPPLHISAVGGDQPVDVTGAGDTVIATFALALASGATFPEAARLANYAGGLVVMKRGTASVTSQELEHSILNSEIQ